MLLVAIGLFAGGVLATPGAAIAKNVGWAI